MVTSSPSPTPSLLQHAPSHEGLQLAVTDEGYTCVEVLDGDWQKILVNPALSDAESALEDIKATRDAIVAQAPTLDELSVETDMTTDDETADEATLMIKTLKKDLAVAHMRYEGRMAQFVDRAEELMMGFYDTYTVILTSLKELQTLEADANMRAMKKLLARADEMDRRVTAIEDRVPSHRPTSV